MHSVVTCLVPFPAPSIAICMPFRLVHHDSGTASHSHAPCSLYRAKVLQSLTVPWLAFNQTATRAQNLTAMPVWLEPHLSILQGIIDTKMELSQDSLACLLSAMECAVSRSPQLASSVKFVQLMMTTMTTYAAALTPTHVNDMLRLATRTKTFLTKPLISKLNKLHS